MKSILIGSIILASQCLSTLVQASTFDFGISFQPQDVAFTQKLSSFRFEPNSEGVILSAYSLLFRYNSDATRFFELEHSETISQISTYNTSSFSVVDSKVSLDMTILRAFDCKPGELEKERFCWGLEAGRDAVPSLQFVSAMRLSMGEVKSTLLGPSALFQYPASPEILIHLKAWTMFGLSGESTDKVSLKSDWKFGTQVGVIQTFDEYQSISLSMDYYIRQAKIETPNATGPLTWNVISSAIVFHLTYWFSF